jgi:hypothetical protein
MFRVVDPTLNPLGVHRPEGYHGVSPRLAERRAFQASCGPHGTAALVAKRDAENAVGRNRFGQLGSAAVAIRLTSDTPLACYCRDTPVATAFFSNSSPLPGISTNSLPARHSQSESR